jgi:FKBP-type peptidyl-prolyl cis-trans isomerase
MTYLFLLIGLVCSFTLQAQQQTATDFAALLQKHSDAFAYSYGAVLGAELKTIGLRCDKQSVAYIVQGIDGYDPQEATVELQKSVQTYINTSIQSFNKNKKSTSKEVSIAAENVDLSTFYAQYGWLVAANWQQFKVAVSAINLVDFKSGIMMANDPSSTFDAQLGQQYITQHYKKLQEAQLVLKQAENDRYFEQLKKIKNLQFSPQGFAYEILQEGTGNTCTQNNRILLRYKGTLIDGTVFDNSPEDGQAVLVDYKGVMKGWQVLFSLLSKGAKAKVYFQPHLGYASRKMPKVPANSILVYEFEIVDLQ